MCFMCINPGFSTLAFAAALSVFKMIFELIPNSSNMVLKANASCTPLTIAMYSASAEDKAIMLCNFAQVLMMHPS